VAAVLTFKVSRVAHWDAEAFRGFWMLQRPGLAAIEQAVTHTVNAPGFAGIAVVLAATAAIRRRPRLLAIMALTLVGANLSTQALKGALPAHVSVLPASPVITGPSFPSGHTTACMSLVLCAVMVAPVRVRPLVAAIGAVYSLAVASSVLMLASHFPSDVIGGFLMAGIWALLALGVFGASEPAARRSRQLRPSATATPLVWVGSLAVALAAVGIVVGPKQVSPIPYALGAALIALTAATSVGAVAEISLRLETKGYARG
jgi:membrane-associated phospholipid phosphatase